MLKNVGKVRFLIFLMFMQMFFDTAWGEDASNFETKFQMITTTFTRKQKTYFYLSAAGTFYIDWGDGSEVETITKSTPSSQSYDHSFPAGGPYTIRIGGRATAYVEQTSNYQSASISFYAGRNSRQNLIYNIAEISGSLGAIFPTINNSQPSFNQTFMVPATWIVKYRQRYLAD